MYSTEVNEMDKIISLPFLSLLMAAISSNPNAPQMWNNLYNNVYFRFMFLYIMLYQGSNNNVTSLQYTLLVMSLFYLLSTDKERAQNFNFKNFNIFNTL